jgi:hypothetical protein
VCGSPLNHAIFGVSLNFANSAISSKEDVVDPFKRCRLGNTDIEVTRMGFGGASLGMGGMGVTSCNVNSSNSNAIQDSRALILTPIFFNNYVMCKYLFTIQDVTPTLFDAT